MRPNYQAGYTLKLITPFLKAYGVTNRKIEEYSLENILLLPGASEMLQFVISLLPSYIVSTSYEQYLSSLCSLTGFPYGNVYCTKLDLDKHSIPKGERDKIIKLKEEIEKFPVMQISDDIKSFEDFSKRDQMTIIRLDEIFWEILPSMVSGIFLQEINPIGNKEKALAIREITERRKTDLGDVMYVGDSVTDTSAFRLIRSKGGLTVSFNGNEYAIKEADVAVISGNASITSILANVFSKSNYDKEDMINMIHEWSYETLKKYCNDKILLDYFMKQHPVPEIEVITKDNIDALIQKSTNFRRSVRGEAIGGLG